MIRSRVFTPESITALAPYDVFVFGSNLNGHHAGGAARLAAEKFGAIEGQAEGLQGQSYAIPTLDENMERLPLAKIAEAVDRFLEFADQHPQYDFYLTKIGCGIAGFDVDEIASIFKRVELDDLIAAGRAYADRKSEFNIERWRARSSVNSGGDWSVNSGRDWSVNSGGNGSVVNLEGRGAIGIAGSGSKIKGKKGCAICLVEFDEDANIIGVRSAIIDGNRLKEDTYYKLVGGEFVEADE